MYLCVESVLTFAINIVFNSNFLFSFNNNNNNNNKYNCIAVIIIITNNNNNVIHYILEKYWTQHNYNASRQCPDSSVSSPFLCYRAPRAGVRCATSSCTSGRRMPYIRTYRRSSCSWTPSRISIEHRGTDPSSSTTCKTGIY